MATRPLLAGDGPDDAAPTRVLAGVSAYEAAGCAILKIGFNTDIDYSSHTPQSTGDELHIHLKPAATDFVSRQGAIAHEMLRPPVLQSISIHAIELDLAGTAADLAVYFRNSTSYRLARGEDRRSLILAITRDRGEEACLPDFDPAAAGMKGAIRSSHELSGDGNQLAARGAEDFLKSARDALARGDLDEAIAYLTKLTDGDDKNHKRECKELLGIARERKGQFAHARAEYEEYLALYPSGLAAGRIKKRLAALQLAEASSVARLQPTSAPAGPEASASRETPSVQPSTSVTESKATRLREEWEIQTAAPPPGPDAWTYGYFGSLSSYYERNQGGRDYYTPPRLNLGWEKDRIDQVFQNSVLSSFDFEAHFERNGFAGRLRAAGLNDTSLLDTDGERNISAFYYDADWKDQGVLTRIGRQSRYSGGVLGRFDGAIASLKTSEDITISATAGSPVERSSDSPFSDSRHFYSLSADFTPWDKGKDFSLFFIEQRADGLIDRQGIGGEFRLTGETVSAYGSTDYDVHYGEFNSLLLSGTRIFPNQSALSASLDFRRSPLVFTTNALQGQGAMTLSQLLSKYDSGYIETIALDRTALAYSANVDYSWPLGEHLLCVLDGTWTYLSANKASAGVEAAPSTGIEFYGLAQITASDMLTTGDSYTSSVRYDDTQWAVRYLLELSARYPFAESWRLNPILRLGYNDFKNDTVLEYEITPTLRLSYLLDRSTTFDFEFGKKVLSRETSHGHENEDEIVILAGVRYDFQKN